GYPARRRGLRPGRPRLRFADQHDRDAVANGVGLLATRADDARLLEDQVPLAGRARQDGLQLLVYHREAPPLMNSSVLRSPKSSVCSPSPLITHGLPATRRLEKIATTPASPSGFCRGPYTFA